MPSGVNTVRRFGCLEGESLCLFLDGFPKIIFVILDLGGKSNVQGYSGIFWAGTLIRVHGKQGCGRASGDLAH